MFLAFKTRKVKIKALNDAKYIAVIIYVTTAIVVVMIVCAVLLSDHLNADGAVFGGLFYIFTTIVLSVLFIPKVFTSHLACHLWSMACHVIIIFL